MAEREEGGWWGSLYKAAKSKSVEVLEFVKRDLDEFSNAVKSEASNAVTSTSTIIKDKLGLDEPDSTANTMKRSMSSFLGQMSNVLNPLPEDDDEEAILIRGSEPVQLSRFQKKFHDLILDTNTFLMEPSPENAKQYEAWLEIEDHFTTTKLSRLLEASPELQMQLSNLVPHQVPELVFWQRFLFRKALLEDEEARLEAVERRAEKEKKEAENFVWDQVTDEDLGGNIEISEEEQTRLLMEYQKECEAKHLIPSPKNQSINDLVSPSSEIDDVTEDNQETDVVSSVISGCTDANESSTDRNVPKDIEIKIREKKDMVIVGSGSSSHTSVSSADKESNDEDWVREFDLDEVTDGNVQQPAAQTCT